MAPASVSATTAPWNWSQKVRNHPANGCVASASFQANQKRVAPMKTFCTTAFSFPAPTAGITTPRRLAKKRNAVISSSRPTSSSATPSAQRLENQLAHALQGIEHAVAAGRDRLDVGGVAHPLPPGLLDQMLARIGGVRRHLLLSRVVDRPPGIQRGLEVLDRGGVREVALVVLDDEGDPGQVVAVLRHVVVQVLHRLDVRFHALDLAVGHEDEAVHALEDELAARVVVHLSRHGVEMKPRLEAANRAEVHGQEVEEQRALGLGGEGE